MNNRRPSELPALWRVIHTGHELEARLEQALGAVDLSLAKLGVLRILLQGGEPMPLSELAKHSRCVRSNMTQLVDRLEADGLVKRVGDADDRRVRRAALTPAGRKACERGNRMVEEVEQEVARALPQADAAELVRALERLTPRSR